jgi:hypothetical protein
MSAQRTVSSARASSAPLKAALLVLLAMAASVFAYDSGRRAGATYEVMAAAPSEARGIAFVRERPCGRARCQTVWIGRAREDAMQVAALLPNAERVDEIAWAKDGFRVAFVINGYQLRLFDAENRKPVGQIDLFPPDGPPTSRVARGITFSQNGAAVTYDDCPRGRSGCKSALAAIR